MQQEAPDQGEQPEQGAASMQMELSVEEQPAAPTPYEEVSSGESSPSQQSSITAGHPVLTTLLAARLKAQQEVGLPSLMSVHRRL